MQKILIVLTDADHNLLYWHTDIDHKNKTVIHGEATGSLASHTTTAMIGDETISGDEWRDLESNGESSVYNYVIENSISTVPQSTDLNDRIAIALTKCYLISVDGDDTWYRICYHQPEFMEVGSDDYCIEVESDELHTYQYTFDEIISAAKADKLKFQAISNYDY